MAYDGPSYGPLDEGPFVFRNQVGPILAEEGIRVGDRTVEELPIPYIKPGRQVIYTEANVRAWARWRRATAARRVGAPYPSRLKLDRTRSERHQTA
jgi:hypothetical protein